MNSSHSPCSVILGELVLNLILPYDARKLRKLQYTMLQILKVGIKKAHFKARVQKAHFKARVQKAHFKAKVQKDRFKARVQKAYFKARVHAESSL